MKIPIDKEKRAVLLRWLKQGFAERLDGMMFCYNDEVRVLVELLNDYESTTKQGVEDTDIAMA